MNHSDVLYTEKLITPLHTWIIGATDAAIKWIKTDTNVDFEDNPNAVTNIAVAQLKTYFDGKLIEFDVPLDLSGYTDFSVRVWKMLLTIPYGKTISYHQLAVMLGDEKCIRAAAAANGRNPIPIIIPCHRVIGSNGSLTGYRFGLDIKKYLLSLELPYKYNQQQLNFL